MPAISLAIGVACLVRVRGIDDPDVSVLLDIGVTGIRVIAAAVQNGIFAGCGGNRYVQRQAEAVRRGALFLTVQTDIGFLSAAAGRWTRGLRAALDSEPMVAR